MAFSYYISFIISLLFCISTALASSSTHPLDPLTPSEITIVQAAISRIYPQPKYKLTFHYVGLDDPHKPSVIQWMTNPNPNPSPRQIQRTAFVVARVNNTTHEITVNLSAKLHSKSKRILTDQIYRGHEYPMQTADELVAASNLTLTYEPMKASIRRRGLKIEEVVCIAFTVAWFGEIKQQKRAVKVTCYYMGDTVNFYMRPIGGLVVTIDLDEMKIIGFRDREVVPMHNGKGTDYRGIKQKSSIGVKRLKSIGVIQPDGLDFNIDGHIVRWANWEFHLGFDGRAGVVISTASIYDTEKQERRSVLYRGYLSELFVPYMDLTEDWYYRTYFDEGEFGMGQAAVSLQHNTDCPENAVFMDAYIAGFDGNPVHIADVMCVFERYSGDIMWRHTENIIPGRDVITESRPEVTLVVRMVSTAGNYDYIFDWEFSQTGSINVKVGLTGILQVKGTNYTHIHQIQKEVSGTLVAENAMGVFHDHFLNFYVDLDIDGQNNSFTKVNLETKVVEGDDRSPRKSYWRVRRETAKTEMEGRVQFGAKSGATELLVVNNNLMTKVGNPVGYRLIPGSTTRPLLLEDDYPQKRAAFTNYNVWITPYNRSEKWASGLLTVQSRGDDTLETWSLRDREIENKDIVLWYTMGFHHVPSQEDFPVMSRISSRFELRPSSFFDANPMLTIKSPANTKWNCSKKENLD